jgi:hypothetical protein
MVRTAIKAKKRDEGYRFKITHAIKKGIIRAAKNTIKSVQNHFSVIGQVNSFSNKK